VVTISSSGVARPDIRKERLDSRLPGTMPARNVGREFLFRWEYSRGPSSPKSRLGLILHNVTYVPLGSGTSIILVLSPYSGGRFKYRLIAF
jgi:hypothetical protein